MSKLARQTALRRRFEVSKGPDRGASRLPLATSASAQSSLCELSWKSRRLEGARLKEHGYRTHAMAGQFQYVQRVEAKDMRIIASIVREGRAAVRVRWHKSDGSSGGVRQDELLQEFRNRIVPLKPKRPRRHRDCRVLLEQRDESGHLGGLPRLNVASQQRRSCCIRHL